MSMKHRLPLSVVLLAVLLTVLPFGGCVSTRLPSEGPVGAYDPALATVREGKTPPDLEVRALLLLLADRGLFEPFTVERALDGGPAVREMLALTLGRVQDRRGVAVLKALLIDDVAAVRRAAALSLGLLEDSSALPNLLRAVVDPDRETGARAVEAVARCGGTAVEVGEALADLGEAEVWARMAPSLFRFQDEAALPLAALALERAAPSEATADAPDARALATYALSRSRDAVVADDLRPLLTDPDPRVRTWAARGLGRTGDPPVDLPRLLLLLDDPQEGPVIEALRAAFRWVAAGAAAPPDAWRAPLARLLTDSRPGVQIVATEAAAGWMLDATLGPILLEHARAGTPGVRAAALGALARAQHPQAGDLVVLAATDAAPRIRRSAVEPAVLLGLPEVPAALELDGDNTVRREAVAARLGLLPLDDGSSLDAAADFVRPLLDDRDAAVRATALAWLAEQPLLPLEEVYQGLRRADRDRTIDGLLNAIQAVAARGALGRQGVAENEKDNAVKILERLLGHRKRAVRRASLLALLELGEPPQPLAPQRLDRAISAYEDIVLRTDEPRRLAIETERGTLTVELHCPVTPFTCLSFLQLAQQGFYDGLTFHRLEPGFLLQTGDPRGDGWGGAGYQVRDEPNLLRFDRAGILGMALSGPDTAGSQFFLTLAPQPHLDGPYTAFGRVTAGLEVLHRIRPGDGILNIHLLP
jgi:cyclophilin family peptidyl-prolyl cis-trans isomerase/HEAT repeat protein